jgi:hypothetical protein
MLRTGEGTMRRMGETSRKWGLNRSKDKGTSEQSDLILQINLLWNNVVIIE